MGKKLSFRSKSIAIMGIKGIPSKGGGERVAEAIINKAINNEFQVYVYGKRSYCTNPINRKNLKLILIKDIKGKHLSAFTYGLFSAIHALIFGKYDLIHLHYADFGYIAPFLSLKFKIIGTSHGAEYNRDKWSKFAKFCFRVFENLFIKYTNICTCVSKPLTKYYKKKYKKEIVYLPNGINFDFNQKDMKNNFNKFKKYNIKKNNYIISTAGRIIPSKGCDILLKANKKLNPLIPLVIIGKIEDLSYKNYLDSLASSNVIFIDFIDSKSDLHKIISNSKFFIFPSTYEAMSMMLLEVASLKKGILCSDIYENYEAIGENAIFFKSGDIDDLVKEMNYALNNEHILTILGQKAYDWVKKNRDWENITQKYIILYNLLLN